MSVLRHCTERSFAIGYRQRTGHERQLRRVNVVAVVVTVVVAAAVVVSVRVGKRRRCDLASGTTGWFAAEFRDGVQPGNRMFTAG